MAESPKPLPRDVRNIGVNESNISGADFDISRGNLGRTRPKLARKPPKLCRCRLNSAGIAQRGPNPTTDYPVTLPRSVDSWSRAASTVPRGLAAPWAAGISCRALPSAGAALPASTGAATRFLVLQPNRIVGPKTFGGGRRSFGAPAPRQSARPPPPERLHACAGRERQSRYPFGGSLRAGRSLTQALVRGHARRPCARMELRGPTPRTLQTSGDFANTVPITTANAATSASWPSSEDTKRRQS